MVCVSFCVICIVELLVSSVICRFQGLSYLHVLDCIRVFFYFVTIIWMKAEWNFHCIWITMEKSSWNGPLSQTSYELIIQILKKYKWHLHDKLEQLERLRSEDTPRRLMITHTIESCWVPNQNKVEWPWRYRSRSKVITCDRPSHASDHLFQIWKESIRNCRCYRADTILKAKAKWPWWYRSRSKVIICNTPSHTSDHLC